MRELVEQVAAHRVVGRVQLCGPLQMAQGLVVVVPLGMAFAQGVEQTAEDGVGRRAPVVVLGEGVERLAQQPDRLLVLRGRRGSGSGGLVPFRERRAEHRGRLRVVRAPGVEQPVQIAQPRQVGGAVLGSDPAVAALTVDVDEVRGGEDPRTVLLRQGRGEQLQVRVGELGVSEDSGQSRASRTRASVSISSASSAQEPSLSSPASSRAPAARRGPPPGQPPRPAGRRGSGRGRSGRRARSRG